MPGQIVLEDFDTLTSDSGHAAPESSVQHQESERLNAFEKGYKAGWDDSAAASSADRQRLSADFAANLNDLSFTYHEARTHVLRGVEGVLRQTIAKILPNAAKAALPTLIWEHVERIAQSAASRPIVLLVSPDSRAQLEELLPEQPGFPVSLREEPTLAEGQVFLRAGETEVSIDLASALREIESAIDEFFQTHHEEERANG